MIDVIRDIDSLTEFKRHTAERIEQIKTTGRPLILTVNGKAEVVVQSAAAYQQTLDDLARLEAQAVQAGIESLNAGRTRPMREAVDELRRKYDLPG